MYKEIDEVATSPRVSGWNPNFPVEVTEEEFMVHIRRIEAGEFMTLEEHEIRFEKWRKEYLANRLK